MIKLSNSYNFSEYSKELIINNETTVLLYQNKAFKYLINYYLLNNNIDEFRNIFINIMPKCNFFPGKYLLHTIGYIVLSHKENSKII